MQEDEELHALARLVAAELIEPDKKQLRFNGIVKTAKRFYCDAAEGVRELVQSCDKANVALYVARRPMWEALSEEYSWMQPIG